ncbi:MAG: cupin domain-containing protein [Pseudomonadota bacterium]
MRTPLILLAALLLPGSALAEDREINGLTGPAAPQGFTLRDLNVIDLGKEFPEGGTLGFRTRYVTLAPGGIVPIHSHEGRPALTYIISGEAIEHRSDTDGPIVRRAGEVTMDVGGIAQWWENAGDVPVVMLVGDVFDQGQAADH